MNQIIIEDTGDKMFKFLKENVRTISEKYDNSEKEWSREQFKCPCCDFISWNSCSYAKRETIRQDFAGYLIHLNNQIRLHASASHIKIFEMLFGEEKTNEFLRYAIAKNKSVTLELERIYNTRLTNG